MASQASSICQDWHEGPSRLSKNEDGKSSVLCVCCVYEMLQDESSERGETNFNTHPAEARCGCRMQVK